MSQGELFRQFTSTVYTEQSKAFLNAFWEEHKSEAETIWDWTHQFITLDHEKGKEGCDLDEFNAHRFLEKLGETKTVREMRDELRAIDMDFNKRMAIIEFLLFRFNHTIQDFIDRPQGDNKEEIDAAQAALDDATNSMQIAIQALDEATTAAAHAKREADAARQAAEEARRSAEEARKSAEEARKTAKIASERAEAAQRAAEEARVRRDESIAAEGELRAILDEIHSQEAARDLRTQQLTARSEDESLGVVQRNKAKNELSQHLAEDPLPLRQAKINQEAATRKAEKARIAAEKSHEEAESARELAEAAQREAHRAAELAEEDRVAAEKAKKAAEKAEAAAEQAKIEAQNAENEARLRANEMEEKFAEAQRMLEEVMAKPGNFQGALWWIQRELTEAKKYMPKKRQ